MFAPMGHGHGHGHGVGRSADRRWLAAALALIVTFMAVEFVVGLMAGSLALISDAAHMLTDAAAIALALVAIRLAARPAKGGYTYGLQPRRDPLRPGQRHHAAAAGRLVLLRGRRDG